MNYLFKCFQRASLVSFTYLKYTLINLFKNISYFKLFKVIVVHAHRNAINNV